MRLRFSISILIILVVLDQLLKNWINSNLPMGVLISLIPNCLSLANVHNSGAAWSILENQQWLFLVLAIVIAIGLFYYLFKIRNSKTTSLTIILLLAGTLGNGIDRLLHGYVVDMFHLDFINFPIFNLADVCLTFGVILLFWILIREK